MTNLGSYLLIEKLLKDQRTICVYKFIDGSVKYIWAIVNEIDANIIYQYSSCFSECITKYEDYYCCFNIFTMDEIKLMTLPEYVEVIPKDVEIIYNEG